MTRDPDRTHTLVPVPADDPAFDAGLAVAFGPDSVGRGWSRPPLLRDDPSDNAPLVRPDSPDMPRADPGRYQLLGEIARGGMGVILKGRDPDLGRDLAVKVLKVELAGKAAAEQRFTEEAQVCGQLQHPGMVPVYELGRFANGQPFFTMKLVKGRTLAALLADRLTAADDRVRFLKDFERVCQTMAYAHSRGVIHRDLKPTNVMVGSFGEVQVMDWGLAKVLPQGGVADEDRAAQPSRERERPEYEPTVIQTARSGSASGSYTEAGSVMGTPAFMPPEQAGGEVEKLDERADVFGLGAILCAILTGQPPYVADTGDAIRLMAIRGELAAAFARLDACGADPELVGLCKWCLATDRDARPRHAGAVRDALTTYLAEVEARAHRSEVARAAAEAKAAEEANTRRVAEEKAAEQHRRRRVQLALAATVGLLLAGGGAFGWWQDRQAAERRLDAANRERDERERLARNGGALADLVDRCEEAIRAGDANRAADVLSEVDRRLADGGGEAVAGRVARCRSDLSAVRGLDAIDAFWWTSVEGKRPDPKDRVGRWRDVLAGYGVAPGAAAGHVAGRIAESLVRDRLLGALDYWLVWDPDPGLRAVLRAADPDAYREAVRDAFMARDRGRMAELAARPEALRQPPRFAAVLGQVTAVPAERRRLVLETALRSRPGDLSLLMALGNSYPITQREGADERVRWFQAAAAVHPHSMAAHNNLGIALSQRGDLDGAIAAYREAIRLDPKVALCRNNLAVALRAKRELDAAIESVREALRLDPRLAAAHHNLGLALRDKGDADGAMACFAEAIRLDPTLTRAHIDLGHEWLARRDSERAAACFREALRLDPKDANAHNSLGAVLCDFKRDYDGAAAHFREAIRLNEKSPRPYHNLATALGYKGDASGAAANYREAIRVDPKYVSAHYRLAWLLAAGPAGVRDGKGAIGHATRACELTAWKDPSCIDALAAGYAETADFDKAVAYQKKALAIPGPGTDFRVGAGERLELYTERRPYRDPTWMPREVGPPPREVKP